MSSGSANANPPFGWSERTVGKVGDRQCSSCVIPGCSKCLVAVVEGGSMSAAAKTKHMSTPTVSESIAKLESLVGETLLVRTSNGCHPTERGSQVMAAAYGLIGEVNRHLATINRPATRPLRVGSTFGVHNSHLARLSERLEIKLVGVSIPISDPGQVVVDDEISTSAWSWHRPTPMGICDEFYAFTKPRVAVFSRHLMEPEAQSVSLEFLDQLIWPSMPADADHVYLGPWLCTDIRRRTATPGRALRWPIF